MIAPRLHAAALRVFALWEAWEAWDGVSPEDNTRPFEWHSFLAAPALGILGFMICLAIWCWAIAPGKRPVRGETRPTSRGWPIRVNGDAMPVRLTTREE